MKFNQNIKPFCFDNWKLKKNLKEWEKKSLNTKEKNKVGWWDFVTFNSIIQKLATWMNNMFYNFCKIVFLILHLESLKRKQIYINYWKEYLIRNLGANFKSFWGHKGGSQLCKSSPLNSNIGTTRHKDTSYVFLEIVLQSMFFS